MINVVRQRKAEIAEICRRFGVVRLEIFGSASAGTSGVIPADIDFLAFLPDGYDFGPWMARVFDLESALSEVLEYPVDVVLEQALENRWFGREASKTRQVIYDASEIAEVA